MLNLINLRLTLILFACTTVIMSFFVCVRYYQSKWEYYDFIDAQANSTAIHIINAVQPAIWDIYNKSDNRNFSNDLSSRILDSWLIDEHIVGIIVYGQFGKIYMGKTKTDDNSILPFNKTHTPYLSQRANHLTSHPIKHRNMTIGKVDIYFNTDSFYQNQKNKLLIELTEIFFISIFIFITLFIAIKKVLLSPKGGIQIAQKTFENIEEAIAFTNMEGRIYGVNPSFLKISTRLKTKIIGSNIANYFPNIFEKISKNKDDSISWRGEHAFTLKNGKKIPVWLTVSLANIEEKNKIRSSELIFVFQDISNRKEAEVELEKLAFFDRLTSLANRQFFETELEASLQAIRKKEQKVALIFIDLDNFKHINDTMGHSAGDEVLIEIAKRFKQRARKSDFIARLGGDEFTVIIRNMNESEEAATLASDLNDIADNPININGVEFKAGASIGISIYPDDANSANELIKHADIAMYNAKESGKGQFAFYSDELNDKVEHYFDLRNRIERAIRLKEFMLYYQPKVELETGKILGAEALIRWIDQDHTLVRPDVFIPMAEETRQIIPIGRWVIHHAIKQLKRWDDLIDDDFSLAINLSPVQLHDKHLIEILETELQESQINPNKLEIEITESAVMKNSKEAIEILARIKALGIKLSLDDFGTGYSSLSYLRSLPVDTLKIDRSFLADSTSDNINGSILTFIIQLSQSLQIEVIAEGIEDKAHLIFLTDQGCKVGQGYYYSPPISADEFQELILHPKFESIS